MVNKVWVLRLGHRIYRDLRMTTHCALTARALGAEGITIIGEKDNSIKETTDKVNSKWGGKFKIKFSKSITKEMNKLKKEKYLMVHLTMYGEKLEKKIKEIRKKEKVCLIVGAEKVPWFVYKKSDCNVSVGNQPHSEIAALAITLHELFEGKELNKKFQKAKIKILPQKKGKKTIKLH
jgi:tRNA (cytidine56-2'-O)-methyltransferase